MKARHILLLLLAAAGFTGNASAHEPVVRARTPIRLPDVPGYVTIKGDFHIHTVFSDGNVWPTIRAEEAWREGLDVIAITDHIEYQPHMADISTNHNRGYEIARGTGASLDVLVIHGSEVTRKMPPGHLNALFLTNSMPLATSNWRDAIAAAHKQGGFIFWNHPGWDAQTANGVVRWYAEHTELLESGMLNGIEVVNGRDYYPEAHRWAIEKKMTMFSNSDIHNPLNLDYHVHAGDHRPLTLVFAKERSLESIKQALFARQTVVYSGDRLIGEERFLRPIFEKSLTIKNPKFELKGRATVSVQVHNGSDVEYTLERTAELAAVEFPKQVVLPAHKTVLLAVKGKGGGAKGATKISLPYNVTNLLIGVEQRLPVKLDLEVTLAP